MSWLTVSYWKAENDKRIPEELLPALSYGRPRAV
jgi:hypothetical protein